MRRAVRHGLAWQPTRLFPAELKLLAQQYSDAGGVSLKVRARMSTTEPRRSPGALAFPTLVGPPAFLAEQLDAYIRLGASYISIVCGYDDDSCADTIDALGVAVGSLRSA
jgi:hypothetical protein